MNKNKQLINFTYLDRQHEALKLEFKADYASVLKDNTLILGDEVTKFECLFAEYCGVKYAAGVGNGLDALTLSLMALGVGPGDEVLVPSNSFIATAIAVSHVNAKPIFIDCDNNYKVDINSAKKFITKKTKAIIPVHLFGNPENISQIMAFAKEFNLFVIEDCAQAHGAKYNGKRVGSFGDIGAFSFYPTKNLGAHGDGGIVVCNNKKYMNKVRMLRNYGSANKIDYNYLGMNSRLDSFQAKILTTKLKYLDRWNGKREKLAHLYLEGLKDIEAIVLPEISKKNICVWHLFVIRCKNVKRNKLLNFLSKNGVMCGIHYAKPLHKAKIYVEQSLELKVSEKISSEVLSLPMDPFLKENEALRVIELIKEFYLQ